MQLRMKKIDRHILGKYLTSFFFCLILFTAIVVVIDISEKAENFSKSGLSTWQIIRDYYFAFIPRIDALLFPLFVFISVIVFTSKMAGRSEIIAIQASGTSIARFLYPYFVGAFFLAGLLLVSNRYLIPVANQQWADFDKKYINFNVSYENRNAGVRRKINFEVAKNNYISIRFYDTTSKTGEGFLQEKVEGNKVKYALRASNFSWDTAQKKWKLLNVHERFIDSLGERVNVKAERFANLGYYPLDLRVDEYLKDQMSTPTLTKYIAREKQKGSTEIGSLLVEKHSRDAIPASVIILTVIGATIASRKVRGGSGAHIAIGVVLSMLYILLSRFAIVFATKADFHPMLAAWTPNIIFAIVALILFRRASK
jgi:lipopolysaccharide export system permease protein